MPSLKENIEKLLELFKEIAIAIREKRHYDRELLIEEMPEEILKIGVYNDWKVQKDADVYTDEEEWEAFINIEGLDYTLRNRFGYVIYQDDGDSAYPHYEVSWPLFTSEDIGMFGGGDTCYYIDVERQKGNSGFFKDDPWVEVNIYTCGFQELDDHVAMGNVYARFEGGADWAGTFVLGGRDPVD